MTKSGTSGPPAAAPPPLPAAPGARVTFLVVPRFNMATLITMIEPMRIANYLSSSNLYTWEIVAFDGPSIVASNGLSLPAALPSERSRRGETVFVLASWGAEYYRNREVLSWLRRQSRSGARLGAVELGCYLLARAGLLAGRRATTHWSWAPGFQEQFHDVEHVEQLYTIDDQVLTCAGGMAGVDLVLGLIAESHGEALAGEIADQMLYHTARPPETPQRRTLGQGRENLPPIVRAAIEIMERGIDEPPRVPEIAAALGVSQRQLERRFREAIGCTVVQFGQLLRLQHARVLLISTSLGVREIAAASGFNSLSHFAQAFRTCFGRRPSDYRQSWPESDPAPSWPGTLAGFLDSISKRNAGSGAT
jgi:transcriptional regulator GlxA family with amidase domain